MATVKSPPPPIQTRFQDESQPSGIRWPWVQWLLQVQSSFAGAEVPSGVIDGNNKIFTLQAVPIAGSLKVRTRAAAATSWTDNALTTGYTLAGNVVTFLVAPAAGTVLECDYRFTSSPKNQG